MKEIRYDVSIKLYNKLRHYINCSEPDECAVYLQDMRILLDKLEVLEQERDKVSDKEGDDAPYVEGKNTPQ